MSTQTALDPATTAQPTFHEQISADLNDNGWSVIDNYVANHLLHELQAEALLLRAAGQYRPAATGIDKIIRRDRGDLIHWLDPDNSLPAQQQFMRQLNSLRTFLNRENFLGLSELEIHAAVYPPGSFYSKHHDNFNNSNHRILTFILYLNPDWSSQDSGQLRLYLPKQHIDIAPAGARRVTFLSQQFPHEVLVTHRQRLSLTGWFRKNTLPF